MKASAQHRWSVLKHVQWLKARDQISELPLRQEEQQRQVLGRWQQSCLVCEPAARTSVVVVCPVLADAARPSFAVICIWHLQGHQFD